ncbi:hypothetical protein ABID20_002720 [Rhizobium alvei]
MRFWKIVVLSTIALTLSGCVINEKNFYASRSYLRKHPGEHAKAIAQCESKLRYMHIEAKRMMSGYMHTNLESMPTAACRRLFKGYISGSMQWSDVKALVERKMFTPRMTQILRGN